MITFEKLTPEEKKKALNVTERKITGTYTLLVQDFLDSGEDIVKIAGYSMTEADKVYNSLFYADRTPRYRGKAKVSKRKENIYLLNIGLNPVADAPERR